MLLLKLDRDSEIPLFQQIFQQIKNMIENQILVKGFRMPSTRLLAEKLGVNRSTVYKAYEELWAMGFIESRPGSYSIVRPRQKLASPASKDRVESYPWHEKFPPKVEAIYQSFREVKTSIPQTHTSGIINLASLDIDHRLFPAEEFRKAINTVINEQKGEAFKYGESKGNMALRETIAARLRVHGISVSGSEILITNGSQNSIELVIKSLTSPGSEVIVESPTYSHALPLFYFYKNRIIEVSMGKSGMDLDLLNTVLEAHTPAFIYTMPNFHNPTGITTEHAHREELLRLAEKFQVPIVEDAFEEEMKYFGKVPLPIKSMDSKNIVIYLGTFSKIFAPGLRLGWIAAGEELIERLLAVKKFSDLSSNNLVQSALDQFCRQGGYDRHIKKVHREYRKRMTILITSLREELRDLDRISWHEPAGGYLTWIQIRDTNLSDDHVKKIFLNHGVSISMGGAFYPGYRQPIAGNNGSVQTFRISISTLNSEEIKEGVQRVGAAISQIYAQE